MLEIHFLQQDNQSLTDPPAEFRITQLKNGNYALSDFIEHHRLNYVLSDWQKIHDTIQNSHEKYQKFLETSKNIPKVNIENNAFWKDFPSENVSSFDLDSFALETEKDFSTISLNVEGDQQMILQHKNFSMDKIMKNPEGNRVFIGCEFGYLYEYLMNEKRIAHDFGQIVDGDITSMATTFDNKYLFMCDDFNFIELDIFTRNQVNNFGVINAKHCVVTYNNQFLITSPSEQKAKLTKWSIQTKQQLHTWKSNVNNYVCSLNCSQDSKYQLIGYGNGWLGIFDIQKDKTLKNIKALSDDILSVAFTQDNQSAFISDFYGHIKMMKWKPNASNEHEFNLNQNFTQVGNNCTYQICLTRDDKNLLVGSEGLVSIFNTETKNVFWEFNLNQHVKGIKLLDGLNNVLIAENNGDLTIINLETLKMSSTHKLTANGKEVSEIAVI